MPGDVSRMHLSLTELLPHRAAGKGQDASGKLWGVVRPPGIPRSSWRGVLTALAMGPRSRPGGTFSFFAEALAHTATDVEVELDPTQPNRLFLPAWDGVAAWIWRLISFSFTDDDGVEHNAVCRIMGVPEDGSYLDLVPVRTSYWNAPGAWKVLGLPKVVAAKIFIFDIIERNPGPLGPRTLSNGIVIKPPAVDVGCHAYRGVGNQPGEVCLVEVEVRGDLISDVPPTYLREDQTTPVDAVTGADTLTVVDWYDWEGFVRLYNPDDEDGESVVLEIASAVEPTLEFTANLPGWAAAGNLLSQPEGRPGDEPFGGHVLTDFIDEGDPLGTGPHPIYLTDGTTLQGLADSLKPLLAAGFWCEIRRHEPIVVDLTAEAVFEGLDGMEAVVDSEVEDHQVVGP